MPLARPIASIDIEATGLDVIQDEIIELAIVRYYPDGRREKWEQRFKPACSISPESTAVHGITDADVADSPIFKAHAGDVLLMLQGCDILGYNCKRFDLPMLHEHLHRAGISWDWRQHKIIDAGVIFMRREERTLEAAVSYFCGRQHEGAHGALADADASLDVLLAQVERYGLTPDATSLAAESTRDGEVMADLAGKFSVDKDGSSDLIFNFGKHKGQKVRDHWDYVTWMSVNAFPHDTMQVARAEYQRVKRGGRPVISGDTVDQYGAETYEVEVAQGYHK